MTILSPTWRVPRIEHMYEAKKSPCDRIEGIGEEWGLSIRDIISRTGIHTAAVGRTGLRETIPELEQYRAQIDQPYFRRID